ncbi:MAG TPA: twin-arginine translocation signal domain-containing protein, partial [Verrucomicrobiota bacterium]|nr:twin-arginine translocation signal domain-containing protein [Verrucomicrobiota bacterium]
MQPTRRQFLKQSTVAVAVAASAPSTVAATFRRHGRTPPHAPKSVAGVHVYADAESVRPGEVIRFHVSADAPYTAELCRLGLDVDDPAGDAVLRRFAPAAPRVQPIHPGSYVHVPRGLRGELRAFTIEAWLRPWRVDRLQGVVSQEDKQDSRGWALGVGQDGYVGFYLGDGVSPDEALVHRAHAGLVQRGRWHHLVGRWDGAVKEL